MNRLRTDHSVLALSLPLAFLASLLGVDTWRPLPTLDLASVEMVPQWQSPWLLQHLAADPQAERILNQYVTGLKSQGFSPDFQGIYIAADRYPVAKYREAQRLPAASLTKVATTLAALETWGTNRRFETRVGYRGTLADGILQGDLIIQGGYDPLFVWEEGIALGNALHRLGLKQVTGDLIVVDAFVMNFQTDPVTAGTLLKQALNSKLWSREVLSQYQLMPPGTPKAQIDIQGSVKVASPEMAKEATGWLIQHQSLPLAAILKAMNIYSNNVMADMVANMLGGPLVVMQVAQTSAGIPPSEVTLLNGSGLGEDNQLSARAAVSLFQVIHQKLRAEGLTIADLFPVVGLDQGTIADRALPNYAAVKTGTLSNVSALAGAFPTQEKGVVWFAIVNRGSDLLELRAQQDKLVTALAQHWGQATQVPADLKTTIHLNEDPYRLGDPQRNQAL